MHVTDPDDMNALGRLRQGVRRWLGRLEVFGVAEREEPDPSRQRLAARARFWREHREGQREAELLAATSRR
ncbi:MAG TPA: hypothetical protein VFD84_11050 [Candidatus Binatia bacterium]|jgi:hypothetical protein|nr:hypothetical protein [Candidatus Binatia bacterium]